MKRKNKTLFLLVILALFLFKHNLYSQTTNKSSVKGEILLIDIRLLSTNCDSISQEYLELFKRIADFVLVDSCTLVVSVSPEIDSACFFIQKQLVLFFNSYDSYFIKNSLWGTNEHLKPYQLRISITELELPNKKDNYKSIKLNPIDSIIEKK